MDSADFRQICTGVAKNPHLRKLTISGAENYSSLNDDPNALADFVGRNSKLTQLVIQVDEVHEEGMLRFFEKLKMDDSLEVCQVGIRRRFRPNVSLPYKLVEEVFLPTTTVCFLSSCFTSLLLGLMIIVSISGF